MKLIIKGTLPGRNEAENAARAHWTKGRDFKHTWTDYVAYQTVGQCTAPFDRPAKVRVTFYEPNQKRDQDNVISGLKYVCDGLVKAGVLKGDSPRHLRFESVRVEYDRDNPRIEVELI